MRRFFSVAVAAAVGLFLGCNASNGPAGAATRFYESLNSSEPSWACAHFQPCGTTNFHASDMDRVATMLVGKISDVRVDERTITTSSTASVAVDFKTNDPKRPLIKADASSASELTADVTVHLKLDGAEKTGVVKMIKPTMSGKFAMGAACVSSESTSTGHSGRLRDCC